MADTDIGIWKLTDDAPQFFRPTSINLEKQLEDWLESDGNLIQAGLHIVGRQMRTNTGFLDLLALDRFGRWSIIEIKRGAVRDETMAQAIRYAAYVADMPSDTLRAAVKAYLEKRNVPLRALLERLQLDETVFDCPRDLEVFVVGTQRDESFDSAAKYTKFLDKPINAVTFSVYENHNGERLLVRELNELDRPQAATPIPAVPTSEQPSTSPLPTQLNTLFSKADEFGYGEAFRVIYAAAVEVGLYPRLYAKSAMYAPMRNKTRFLIFTPVTPNRQHQLRLVFNTGALAEFYPVTEKEIVKYLGKGGDQFFDLAGAQAFAQQLKKLFELISKKG